LRIVDDAGPVLQLVDRETLAELARTQITDGAPVSVFITAAQEMTSSSSTSRLRCRPPVNISVGLDGGSDALTLSGALSLRPHIASGSGAGFVDLTFGASTADALDYTGIEGIVDLTFASDRIFANETGTQQQIRLSHTGQLNGLYDIDSNGTGGFAPIRLAEPAVSLTVRAGDQGDTLFLGGPKPDAIASISLTGGAGSDTLIGPAFNTLWTIDGTHAGKLNDPLTGLMRAEFAGIENLTGAADAEDSFIIEATGSLSGAIDGGTGSFDELLIRSAADTVLIVPTHRNRHFDGRTVARVSSVPTQAIRPTW
jgi:hypothetical protein